MIVGDPDVFAIESEISEAYSDSGLCALGFFVVYINGVQFGIREMDATLLGCSFNKVRARIAGRGKHQAPFAEDVPADVVATTVRRVIYGPINDGETFFGRSENDMRALIRSNALVWAPDGDEAFDDSSHILQFDVRTGVRLVASKRSDHGIQPGTLTDLRLAADTFYGLLAEWLERFESGRNQMAKTPLRD